MKITNCLESRCVSWRKNVRLFAALAFCTILVVASGCASTGGKDCCAFNSNDPGKLATVNEPSSNATTSRGQSTDVSSASAPSEESQERHNKAFTGAIQETPQTTISSENAGASSSLATNGSASNSPTVESLDSFNYMTNTAKPTNESNIPNIMGVPAAQPQAPSEGNEGQSAKQDSTPSSQSSSNGSFLSVAPSPGQESKGASGERLANSSENINSDSNSNAVKPEVGAEAGVKNETPEPPVEMSSEKTPTTFAEDAVKTDESAKTSETSPAVPEKESATTNRSNEPAQSQTPDPTLDTSVPVTFKPTAFSRVVEIRSTSASEVLESSKNARQRSAQRVPSGVSLVVPGVVVGKPIDASKDLSHLTRIPRR